MLQQILSPECGSTVVRGTVQELQEVGSDDSLSVFRAPEDKTRHTRSGRGVGLRTQLQGVGIESTPKSVAVKGTEEARVRAAGTIREVLGELMSARSALSDRVRTAGPHGIGQARGVGRTVQILLIRILDLPCHGFVRKDKGGGGLHAIERSESMACTQNASPWASARCSTAW